MARRRRSHRRHHVNRHHRRRHLRNPRGYRRSRRRLRNPRHGGGGVRLSLNHIFREAVVPATVGGVGALGLDVLLGYVNPYLPASVQSTPGSFNPLNLLVKLAGAVGLGMVAGKFMGSSRGRTVMIGAMTVTAYSAIRTFAAGSGIPGLSGLGGYSDYTPYPMGAYMRGPTGTPGIQGLGYVSPGAVIAPTLTPRLGAYMARPMNVAAPLGGDYGDGM